MLSKMQAGIANPQTKQTVNLQVQRATFLPTWKRPGLLWASGQEKWWSALQQTGIFQGLLQFQDAWPRSAGLKSLRPTAGSHSSFWVALQGSGVTFNDTLESPLPSEDWALYILTCLWGKWTRTEFLPSKNKIIGCCHFLIHGMAFHSLCFLRDSDYFLESVLI